MKLFLSSLILASFSYSSALDDTSADKARELLFGSSCPPWQIPTADGLRCRLPGKWKQMGEDIEGLDGFANTGIASSLSGSGRRVVVDSTVEFGTEKTVKVYQRAPFTPEGWKQIGNDLVGERLGSNTDINRSGNIIALGGSGTIQTYKLNPVSGNWETLGSELTGPAPFGTALSISANGRLLAAGSRFENNFDGSVRIYSFENGDWVQVADFSGEPGSFDEFGLAVSFSDDGSTFAVGTPADEFNDDDFTSQGSVTIFRRNRLTNEFEELGQKIEGSESDSFAGASLALNRRGNTLVVGEFQRNDEGAAFVYSYSRRTNKWHQVGDAIVGAPGETFVGQSVSISDNGRLVAVSATDSSEAGVARVYLRKGRKWIQIGQELRGEGPSANLGRVNLSSNGFILSVAEPNPSLPFPIPGAPPPVPGEVAVYKFWGGRHY